MILTVTLNAALDVTYTVPALRPGEVHRVTDVTRYAGGKGINVSRVAHQLGHDTLATGFAGGPAGEAIRSDLRSAGVPHRFVTPQAARSRTTVAVVDAAEDEVTVFNEPGEAVSEADWAAFTTLFDQLATQSSCVVMSGSLPPGLPGDAYARLCRLTDLPRLVDTTGDALLEAARAGADVLLPNAAELEAATGLADPVHGARTLIAAGGGAVVVSRGADGLIAVTPDRIWRAAVPERLRGNPTGAGDALTAAVAATHGQPWPERIREAIAWSAAAVPVPYAGGVDTATLERIRPVVEVVEIEEVTADGAGSHR